MKTQIIKSLILLCIVSALADALCITVNAQTWNTTGNAGTNASANYIGTTDNHSFVIRSNNTNRIFVDSTGKVGIGTSTPSAQLHFNGSKFNLTSTSTTASSLIKLKYKLEIQNGTTSTTFATFDAVNKRVGIGTTAPTSPLHVTGTSSITGLFNNVLATGDGYGVYGEASIAGTGSRYALFGYAANGVSSNYGVHGFGSGGTTAYGVYGGASGGTTNWAGYFDDGNLYVKNKVGIGNLTPAFALDVSSNLFKAGNFVNTATSADNVGVSGSCNNTPDYGYGVVGYGGKIGLYGIADMAGVGDRYGLIATGQNGTMANYGIQAAGAGGTTAYGIYASASGASGNNNWAAYFGGGNVKITNRLGIGNITSPSFNLEVYSPDYTAVKFRSAVNGGTTFLVDASALTGNIWAIAGAAPTSGYAGYFDGNTYCTGSYLPSDERLKENIQPLQNALEKVMKLNIKSYNFKQGLDKMNLPVEKQYGFTAQNLETVFPELVRLNPAKAEQPVEFKAVNYIGMIPVLTQALQEQQQQIESQKTEDGKLKAEVEELKSQLAQMQKDLSQCCMSYKSAASSSEFAVVDAAKLEQNIPNPFTSNTIIRFYIPQSSGMGVIKVYTLDGSELKSIPITTKGFSQTEISGKTLSSGTYTYMLLLDGKVVDTKQMVLTK